MQQRTSKCGLRYHGRVAYRGWKLARTTCMPIAQFEEKEFEGPLNLQLAVQGRMWSPGQVLEKLVGFDAALLVHDAVFWARNGFTAPPPGATVLPGWWPWASSVFLRRKRVPPSYPLNVFLQYKRPEYLSGGRASEWSHWKRPYFRVSIIRHQQRALVACANEVGRNGVVAYASPAFHSRTALFNHVEQQTLVANTHFANPRKLTGHSRYTYVGAKQRGKAHSKVVDVAPISFDGSGDDGPPRPGDRDGDGRGPESLFEEARRASEAALEASPRLVGSRALLDRAAQRASTYLGQASFEGYEVPVENFVFVAIFSAMSGIAWAIA